MKIKQWTITLKFIFAWYDIWVGFFWDREKKKLYIFPIPMLGVVIHFSNNKGVAYSGMPLDSYRMVTIDLYGNELRVLEDRALTLKERRKFKTYKWAVYANDLELAAKVIEKLKQEGYMKKPILPEEFIYWGAYIPELDIMVSHLCLEMHYPQYEKNLIYGDKYLKES